MIPNAPVCGRSTWRALMKSWLTPAAASVAFSRVFKPTVVSHILSLTRLADGTRDVDLGRPRNRGPVICTYRRAGHAAHNVDSSKLCKIGEDVTETLDVVPRQWFVTEHVREKFSCRSCETITQPPAPFHAITRGFAGPSLLAMMLVEKYANHQPLGMTMESWYPAFREGLQIAHEPPFAAHFPRPSDPNRDSPTPSLRWSYWSRSIE
jgi:zinc-finger binding domain of transposase IS66